MVIPGEPNKAWSQLAMLLLAFALLAAQGTRLHVHYQECAIQPAAESSAHAKPPHQAHGKIHLVTSHAQYSHSTIGLTDLDLSPQGLLKTSGDLQTLLWVLVGLSLLLLIPQLRRIYLPACHITASHRRHYCLPPPLRAPPGV